MQFNFPATKFAQTTGLYGQLVHLGSEIKEVERAFYNDPMIERVAEELMDVIHSAETALRIICRTNADVNLHKLRLKVEKKNLERGYYD